MAPGMGEAVPFTNVDAPPELYGNNRVFQAPDPPNLTPETEEVYGRIIAAAFQEEGNRDEEMDWHQQAIIENDYDQNAYEAIDEDDVEEIEMENLNCGNESDDDEESVEEQEEY
ncbi:unnamed protein product [Clavelina lepadiformis]|uniref:Uncharacterized protein n=1 Tax=Clavelina lepadiformis TaxID=159417 RepID=A0ABP0GYV0_CLALP